MTDTTYVAYQTIVDADALNAMNTKAYHTMTPMTVTVVGASITGVLAAVPTTALQGAQLVFLAPVAIPAGATLAIPVGPGDWQTPLPLYQGNATIADNPSESIPPWEAIQPGDIVTLTYNYMLQRWYVGTVVGADAFSVIESPWKLYTEPLMDYSGQLGTPTDIAYSSPIPAGNIAMPQGSTNGFAYCPTNNKLYRTDGSIQSVSTYHVATGEIVQLNLGLGFDASTFAPTYCPINDCMYILATNGGNNQSWLYVLDCATDLLVSVLALTIGSYPSGMAYCPVNNLMYIAGYSSGQVYTVSCASNQFFMPPISVGLGPTDIIYVPSTQVMYVPTFHTSVMFVVSVVTNTVVATIGMPDSYQVTAMAYNPYTDTLYLGFANMYFATINPSSNTVSGAKPLGYYPDTLIFNPSGGSIYGIDGKANSTIYAIDPVYGNVSVIASLTVAGTALTYCPINSTMVYGQFGSVDIAFLDANGGAASLRVPPSVAGTQQVVQHNQMDTLYAPIGGVSTSFAVGAAVAGADAMQRVQMDTSFEPLSGDASYPFQVGAATAQQHAVTLAQSLAGASPFNVTASRSFSSTYQNFTSRPMCVSVSAVNGSGSAGIDAYTGPLSNLTVTGVHVATAQMALPRTNDTVRAIFFVPPWWYYEVTSLAGTTVSLWTESM